MVNNRVVMAVCLIAAGGPVAADDSAWLAKLAVMYGVIADENAALDRNALSELGFVAFGQQSGAVGPGSDLLTLPRFPMAEAFANLDDFAAKVATWPRKLKQVASVMSPVYATRLSG